MAEEAAVTTETKQEVKNPPAAPITQELTTDQLVDKVRNRTTAKQEAPAEQVPPADSKEPVTEVKDPPANNTVAAADTSTEEVDEFGIEGMEEIVNGIKFDTEEQENPEVKDEVKTDAPTGVVNIKDLASRFGVEANTPEEFEKSVKEKYKNSSSQGEDYTQPLRDLDGLLAIKDDRELLSKVLELQGYNADEAKTHLDLLEESDGKSALKKEALKMRVGIRQQREEVVSNIDQYKATQQKARADYETNTRSFIASMDKVYGVPVDKAENNSFAEEFLTGKFEKQFADPKTNLEATRLVRDFPKIKKQLIESGVKAGFKQANKIWRDKMHNQNLTPGKINGGLPPKESNTKDTDAQVNGAQSYIRNRAGLGTMVRPQ